MKIKITPRVLIPLLFFSCFLHAQESFWKLDESEKRTQNNEFSSLKKEGYKIFTLDINGFKNQLKSLQLKNGRSNATMSFPNSDGKMERFTIKETQVMAPHVAERFPNIKTYIGYGIDNHGSRIRFSVTPHGVQTMTSYHDRSQVYTVPVKRGDVYHYISYDRSSRKETKKSFECHTEGDEVLIDRIRKNDGNANDQTLRTFRIAISTTGEYTNFWDDGDNSNGDAKADAMAQIVSTLNRTNEVFEVDMAINFQLVSTDNIIYTDPLTDPYTGDFSPELQSTLTSIVQEANYDIGHLFHHGSNNGSAGCIGCVCVDGAKGSGFSAHRFTDNNGGPYMSDFFDIDYVPHEIGHQMGAFHTHTQADDNTVNYEPGSGTTIMGYAGITGSNDVQDHSDPYFHYASIDQIVRNVKAKSCYTTATITNNPPVANAGNDYIIPKGTAFVLKGAATDADTGNVLTYTWEQIDDGLTNQQSFSSTLSSGPIFRSRPPSTNPNRYMPTFSRVLEGKLTETNPFETVNNTSWETVSTVARDINFALTVRDRSQQNGVGQTPQSSFDFMKVTVDESSGPFAITSPSTSESWIVGAVQTITWNVAGTNTGNINVSTVNILMSLDGGQTFTHTLASNTENDGSFSFTVPDVGDISKARVMIEANGNIFFAVNAADFSIIKNFTFQPNDFSIQTVSESCADQNDGSINVVLKHANFSYTVNITGTASVSKTFVGAFDTFAGLAPGPYRVCIKVNNLNYEQCFEVNIQKSQPISLRLGSNSGQSSRLYTFNVDSGTSPFRVFLNNKLLDTFNSNNFSLEILESGRLEIQSAKECEGTYRLAIDNVFLMKNPVDNVVELQLPINIQEPLVEVFVFDITGKQLTKRRIPKQNNSLKIPFEQYSSGVYMIKLGSNANPIKVIKQ